MPKLTKIKCAQKMGCPTLLSSSFFIIYGKSFKIKKKEINSIEFCLADVAQPNNLLSWWWFSYRVFGLLQGVQSMVGSQMSVTRPRTGTNRSSLHHHSTSHTAVGKYIGKRERERQTHTHKKKN